MTVFQVSMALDISHTGMTLVILVIRHAYCLTDVTEMSYTALIQILKVPFDLIVGLTTLTCVISDCFWLGASCLFLNPL